MRTSAPSGFTRARWWQLATLVVLLALVSSAIGVRNGYAYDDVYVVQNNAAVHSLHDWWRLFAQSYWPPEWGGDGYRPLTMLAFTVQWVAGHGAAWVFHLVNLLLYCGTALAVFWLASELLPPAAAWLAAALFAVHPVHVEAVANVVGQSELWVGLLATVAMAVYLRARAGGTAHRPLSPRSMAGIALLFTAALFFKEHAIVLPAILLVAETTVVRDERPLRERLVRLRPFGLTLALIGVAFLWARTAVKGGDVTGFAPYIVFQSLELSYVDRVLTMVGVVPTWVRLLLWPAHLLSEYAPPYVRIAEGVSITQLPGLALLVGVFGLCLALWRRRDRGAVISFGIATFCLALLPSSNFILPAGIILAERTLFLPSVGAMLAVAAALNRFAISAAPRLSAPRRRALRWVAVAAAACILAAGSWRSITRTPVWKDNDHLMRQGIVDAPDSYRAHYMLANVLLASGRRREAEQQYRRAMLLFPYDTYMAYNFARQYQSLALYAQAVVLYEWVFSVNPHFEFGRGRGHYAASLLAAGHPEQAREQVFEAIRQGGAPLRALRGVLQRADSTLVAEGRRPPPPRPRASVGDSRHAGKLPLTVQNTPPRPVTTSAISASK